MKPDRVSLIGLAAVFLTIVIAYSQYHYNYQSPPKPEANEVYNSQVANKLDLIKSFLNPQCDNIFVNMTRGKWVKKVDLEQYADEIEGLTQQEERQVKELEMFWMESGIQSATWSSDVRCGYKNFQTRPPKPSWPRVGRWCDPRSDRPCCTNILNGTCMPPSEGTCNCPGCVDLREYKYAEKSDWIVDDEKCKWRNYTASQICDVIEGSPFWDIYYVGDSFMRKMYRTLSVMITDDFEYGGMDASTPLKLQKLCKNLKQYYYSDCRNVLIDISKVLNKDKLCGGRGFMNFTVTPHVYFNTAYKTQFTNLVKSKLDVNGSLIVLGVGSHMGCNFRTVIEQYLGPAIDVITERYGSPTKRTDSRRLSGRWPQIIFCLPPQMGLLKPLQYLKSPSTESCIKFGMEMRRYAERHDISIVDFRPITQFLHSYDGTHHALGVNRLKNLIILNYIASLDAV